MDKRVIPGSFIRDRLRHDDNFYVIVNSHDKDSERLSEKGVRTGWRNALPMRLELVGGLWEVALLQLQMQNVQKVHHRLTLADWTDPDIVLSDVPLEPSVGLTGLNVLDGVFRTLPAENNFEFLEEEFIVRLTRNNLYGFARYSNAPSPRQLLQDAQAGLSNKDFMDKYFSTHANDYYTVQHPIDGSQPPFDDTFKFEDRGAYYDSKHPKAAHHKGEYVLRDAYHIIVYEGVQNYERTTFFLTPCLESAVSSKKKNRIVVTRPSDGREFVRFDANYLIFDLNALDETLMKSRPTISLERGRDGQSLELYCRKKIDLISSDGDKFTLPRFMSFADDAAFFREMNADNGHLWKNKTVRHVDFFVENLEFEVAARDSRGSEVQGRLDAAIDLEAHTDGISKQMNYLPNRANVKYHALKRVNTTSLDLKIASSFPDKFDPTFLTGPVTAVLHFRKDLIDSHHRRHVPF